MFTGIVQAVGRIASRSERDGDVRLVVDAGTLPLANTQLGDSIAVSGVCLTVVELKDGRFAADVSRETLSLTTLGELHDGSRVNLEPALRVGDSLGGHFVSGHVDGVAVVRSVATDARSTRVRFTCDRTLVRYVVRKGSVTLDGVSLTVNEVEGVEFGVNLIPHTQDATTLGALVPGMRLNLEVDQLARYVERLLGEAAAQGV